MHANERCFVDAQHAIITEIGLLNVAALQRDFTEEHTRKPEDDSAFHLSAHAIGIHRNAAIDRAVDAYRPNRAILVQLDLDDLSDKGSEPRAERNAARALTATAF